MDFNPLSSLTVEHDKLMHLLFFFFVLQQSLLMLQCHYPEIKDTRYLLSVQKRERLYRNIIYSLLREPSDRYKLSLGAQRDP